MPDWKVELTWQAMAVVEAETATEAIGRLDSEWESVLKEQSLLSDARVSRVEVED